MILLKKTLSFITLYPFPELFNLGVVWLGKMKREILLIIYYCVTNYHKIQWLKVTYIYCKLTVSGIQIQCRCVFCFSVFHKIVIKELASIKASAKHIIG